MPYVQTGHGLFLHGSSSNLSEPSCSDGTGSGEHHKTGNQDVPWKLHQAKRFRRQIMHAYIQHLSAGDFLIQTSAAVLVRS